MQARKTSFVIRTYNEEKWLRTTLEALFSQTRKDFEVIVVDSGSTDTTLSIINDFPDIRLMNIPHEAFHYSYAINIAIPEAKGELIGILSGHSVPISDHWYADVFHWFDNPLVAGITGSCIALPDGTWDEKLSFIAVRFLPTVRHHWKWLTNSNSLIRKSCWEEYHFDETLLEGCEDVDWAEEMLARGYDIILDQHFNTRHSHGGLGKKTFLQMQPTYRRILKEINARNRSRKSG